MLRALMLLLPGLVLSPDTGAEDAPVAAVNALRQSAGLPALSHSRVLSGAARAHAAYLEEHREPGPGPAGVSAHSEQPGRAGFTGETPHARALAAGYPHRDVLENVSMGFDDLAAALDGLMGAIYHRLTFLDLLADEMGASGTGAAQVFVLGRRDLAAVCRAPDPGARFEIPVDCLGTAMTRDHYDRLCADLPREARFVSPHPVKCPNGRRLDAEFMGELCSAPPAAARLAGEGRYYLPCGDRGPAIDGDWFDAFCEAPPPAAAYAGSGRYYELCEPARRVSEEWLQDHCATLPEFALYRESGRFRMPCAEPHELRIEYLDSLDAERLRHLPEAVLWPPPGHSDVPPAFFVEEPDPLPDREVSGYPLSIQFNPGLADEVVLAHFRLWRLDGDSAEPETQVRLMDAGNDPHGQLGSHEFVLFPLQRLAWGARYRAEVMVRMDGEPRRFEWHFRVRDHGLPLLTADGRHHRFVVQPGTWYLLYLPPASEQAHTVLSARTEHLRGNQVNLEVVDPNTLKLRVRARYCDRMRMTFDGGRRVELIPAGCDG